LENYGQKSMVTSLHRHRSFDLLLTWAKGHKFINGFNMVRLGLADAHSAAIYNSPKYGRTQSWSMKSVGDLTAFYKRLIATISEKPYGPYQGHCNDTRKKELPTDWHATPTVTPLSLQHLHNPSARPVSITEQQPSSSKRALAARQEGNDEDLYPTLLTQKRTQTILNSQLYLIELTKATLLPNCVQCMYRKHINRI